MPVPLVRRHLSIKIILLLLPLLLAGMAGFSWFLLSNRAQVLEDENFRKAKTAALVGSAGMAHFLEELVSSGTFTEQQVFDERYQKIIAGPLAGAKIPKYHTAYDAYLDDRIRHFEDAFLSDESVVFAVLVDRNGYLPTHNSRYSLPLTGDDDRDRVGNRTKRLFDDPVGLAAARYEGTEGQLVLRQVYPRDTGVIMWDVSAPVKVFGRHWGAFRIGLSMERTAAEIQNLTTTILFASAGFGLVTILFVTLVLQRVTQPLKHLSLAARAIAEGRRNEPIKLQSEDEIGELVGSFNQMLLSLAETTVSRDFFDRIIHSVQDLLLVVSPTGELRSVNKAFLLSMGCAEQELLGRNVRDLFQDKVGSDNWCERLMKARKLESEDVFLMDHQGTILPVSLSASPLYDEHSQVDSYIIICQNNSRRIRAEKEMESAFDKAFALNAELRDMNDSIASKNLELDEAYQKLKNSQSQILQQEKMASIGQLAAGVAHEINNPMGFITSNLQSLAKYLERLNLFMGAQQLLLQEKLSREELQPLGEQREKLKIDYVFNDGRELIEESLDGAARVKTIVQNLKSFSRVDQAQITSVNLNDCLESTISIAWNELKYKITLIKNLGELDPLLCHPQQLNQVFLNILVNAAQAIETHGSIWVSTFQDASFQYVEIRDDGSGIPEGVRRKIFEPFFTTKPVGKGTGLGMSISYDIVKRHGGRIELESELGVGTTFTVILPREGLKDAAEVNDGRA